MLPVADAFDHEHAGCDVLYGRGRASELGDHLGDRGLDDALVVCGSTVGANDALMDPIRAGLGDRYAGTFDGTTPAKRVESAFDVIAAMRGTGADVLVGVGGGSSLDVARQAAVLAADGRDLDALEAEAHDGPIAQPTADPAVPVVVVPTTFAGADLSPGGSLEVVSAAESPTGQPISVSGSATPIADLADPALFETTPRGALAGSAMNGFDKGIETPYAEHADPVSDATAVHGLRLLSGTLPIVAGDRVGDESEAMDRAVAGALLVQIDRKIGVIHAFGHGFARRYEVQQGAVHAVLAPHVLSYLFDEVDAARRTLAAGLDVDVAARDDGAVAEAVVAAVTDLRDSLDVPHRLRDLDPTRAEDLPEVAAFIADDRSMAHAPAGVDGSADRIEGVLRAAW